MKKLLLIGGGQAHAETLVAMAEAATANAEVTVVNPRRLVPWKPMLPGLVAGQHAHAACHYDLAALTRVARATLVEESVVGFDPEARLATTESGRKLEFDFASINVEAGSDSPEVPGVRQNALLERPTEVFLEGWERVLELVCEGRLRTITLIGGHTDAVELMLAMHHRLRNAVSGDLFDACGFSLVTAGARLVDEFPDHVSAAIEAICQSRGISLLRGAPVTEVGPDFVQLANGARLATDVTVWTGGHHLPRWIEVSGVAREENGLVKVDAQLRSASHPHVLAAGDCVGAEDTPDRNPVAFRAQQARLLAGNLLALLAAQAPTAWSAPADSVQWISVGTREALGLRAGLLLDRARWWLWQRKDRADRRALRRYRPQGH